MHILTNIPWNKGNEELKFGQSLKCNMRNVFHEKFYTKCRGEADTFLKNQNSTVLYSLLLLYAKLRNIKIYWNQVADHLLLIHIKLFLKYKERSGTNIPLIFCMIFEEKYFSCDFLLPDQISLSGYLYIDRYWEMCVLSLFVNQVVMS